MLTGNGGWPIWSGTYLPFGYEWNPQTTVNTYKFTGMERDSQPGETGLDHTWFRQYNSAMGRWMTPDPAGMAAADPTNPQSWNRYAYVMNSPLAYLDPLGLVICPDCGGGIEPPPIDPDPVDPCFFFGEFCGGGGSGQPPLVPPIPLGAGGGGANNGQTPRQAAVQNCQKHGQVAFNIPFTKVPVTISLSATLGPVNYSATNDINTVFPVIPWPEWLAGGASVDVTINAPSEPSSNPSVGLGKNLSLGYFTTPHGAQGLSLSIGPSVGPPINIAVPTNNACGMLVGGKG